MRKVISCSIPEERGYFFLKLPRGAQPLYVLETENGEKMFLAVNVNATIEKKKFLQVETGEVIEKSPPNKLVPIGIRTKTSSGLINHVFEVK